VGKKGLCVSVARRAPDHSGQIIIYPRRNSPLPGDK